MEATRRYNLPVKSRILLWLLSRARRNHGGLPTPKELRRTRASMPRFFLLNWILGKPDRRCRSEDRLIPVRDAEIGVRIYSSKEPMSRLRPLIINFHGGGWAAGNLQNCDFYCSLLAAELDAVVVSVDYRLAPEYKFPVAVHDCYDALLWAVDQCASLGANPQRLVVTGDSAGGNLAAAMTLMARNLGGPKICLQALIYPAVDSSLSNPSISRHAFAPILTKKDMENFLELYARDEVDRKDPYLSPWNAESVEGLPDAIVVTAGYDPLQDDGRLWVERLRMEGIQTEELHYPEDIHGFFAIPHFTRSGLRANHDLVRAIKRALKV